MSWILMFLIVILEIFLHIVEHKNKLTHFSVIVSIQLNGEKGCSILSIYKS